MGILIMLFTIFFGFGGLYVFFTKGYGNYKYPLAMQEDKIKEEKETALKWMIAGLLMIIIAFLPGLFI